MKALTIWQDIQTIRQTMPLIHNITNYVVMNTTANALLALGASPIMAHAQEELNDILRMAKVLVMNIGTLDKTWVENMAIALHLAVQYSVPVVFDPVGVGATVFRSETALCLLNLASPAVIRGNASEIMALCQPHIAQTKGVDSTQFVHEAVDAARALAQQYKCTVVISGETDIILDTQHEIQICHGHPMMARVTGLGCTATALIGAFLAVNSSPWQAAVHAMTVMGIAGEIAAERASGPGSLQMHLLDVLYQFSETDLNRCGSSQG